MNRYSGMKESVCASGIRGSDFGNVKVVIKFQYAVHVRGICKLRLDKIGTIVSVRLEVRQSSYKIIIEKA
jgi:hypothetical protein